MTQMDSLRSQAGALGCHMLRQVRSTRLAKKKLAVRSALERELAEDGLGRKLGRAAEQACKRKG